MNMVSWNVLLQKCSEIHIGAISLKGLSLRTCGVVDTPRRAVEALCLERSEGEAQTRASVSLWAKTWRQGPVNEAPEDIEGDFWGDLGWWGACSRGGSRAPSGRDDTGPRASRHSCVALQNHGNDAFAAGHSRLEERSNQLCWNHVCSFGRCFSFCQVLSEWRAWGSEAHFALRGH